MKKHLIIILILVFLINLSFGANLLPNSCLDSDGDCSIDNIRDLDGIYEAVDLLTNPFGWIETTSFTDNIPEQNTIDSAFLQVSWLTDTGFGATNINIDYWNSTNWINCAGPFSEANELQNTTCNITHLTKEQLTSLKIRLRGQDLDGFPNAFAYIDLIKLEVNHSAPPIFGNQTYPTIIFNGQQANISVQVYDDVGLSYAILSTNETGKWKNYTDGTYGSPIYFNGESNQWKWANFTWSNASFLSGDIGWKIYLVDITGKTNETNNSFFVQYKRNPTGCLDSDGDCNIENINKEDNIFESIDLLTFPFGWLEVYDWDTNVSNDVLLDNVKLVIKWKTDVDFGAQNINIDYWDDSWKNCAGPYNENENLQESICILNLSSTKFNSLKVRLRGEDSDGFPNAFAYIDSVYILANLTKVEKNYLIVDLVTPKTLTYLAQNYTFLVNATVYCEGGMCGNVSGIIRYNASSSMPDTPISNTPTEPFYLIYDTAEKNCSTNPLNDVNEFCNLTWIVNATGNIGSVWQIGVLFNSTNNNTEANHTINATVEIQTCIIDITLSFSKIDFGEILPNSFNNSAFGNNDNSYNISINPGSCSLDVWIKGDDLKGASIIYVSNISWNTENNLSTSKRLLYQYSLVKSNVLPQNNITTYYWIDMPPAFYGKYYGNITIKANKTVIE
ncbi:MAG: hypothetical protein QW350_03955 [Candidatus Aenigmatarchaeota archaeon]